MPADRLACGIFGRIPDLTTEMQPAKLTLRAGARASAELLAEVGGRRLIRSVRVRNPAAMAFYESLGGEDLDEERFLCWRAPNWPR